MDLYTRLKCFIHLWSAIEASTLNSTYNEKKYAELLLHYRQLFIKGNVIIGEWGVFGVEIFLHYS